MRPRLLLAAVSVSLALAACATGGGRVPVAVTPASGAAAPEKYAPLGEVQVAGPTSSSATFDDWRVVGPRISVTRVDASTWGGNIGDQSLRLQVRDGRIQGAGMSVAVERSGDVLEIGGVLGETRIRFELSPRHMRGTVGQRTFEMGATAPGQYSGNGRVLHLTGAAADLSSAPMPQLALALIAATSE